MEIKKAQKTDIESVVKLALDLWSEHRREELKEDYVDSKLF